MLGGCVFLGCVSVSFQGVRLYEFGCFYGEVGDGVGYLDYVLLVDGVDDRLRRSVDLRLGGGVCSSW